MTRRDARPSLLPRRRLVRATELELGDLQGNLVRGYTFPVGRYVFVRVADAAAGRRWLAGLLPSVTERRAVGRGTGLDAQPLVHA